MKRSPKEIIKLLKEKGVPLQEETARNLARDYEQLKEELLNDLEEKKEKDEMQIMLKLQKLQNQGLNMNNILQLLIK